MSFGLRRTPEKLTIERHFSIVPAEKGLLWRYTLRGIQGCMEDLTAKLNRCRAFVFDFDGTLVDSNDIKTKAFETKFSDHDVKSAAISQYCRESVHLARFDKFEHIYRNILNLRYTPHVQVELNRRFNHLTTDAV